MPHAGQLLHLRLTPRVWIAWLEARLKACRKLGDRWGEDNSVGNPGGGYSALGEPRRAIEYYEQHLAIARELGDQQREGNALSNPATFYLGEEPRRAIEYYEQHLPIARETDKAKAPRSQIWLVPIWLWATSGSRADTSRKL